MRWDDPREAAGALTGCREPFLLGVRHHSPSLAAAVPELLAAAAPDVLFVELPAEFQRWLPHLADPRARAPLALAGSGPDGVVFLPFADFSPELAALRWAREAGVEAVAFDLPLSARAGRREVAAAGDPQGRGRLAAALRRRAGGRAHDDLWDRLVEAAAPGCAPQELRRAALAVGWALRCDAEADGGVDPYDLAREAHMRRLLAGRPGVRAAAVVGAFHAAALLPGAAGGTGPEPAGAGAEGDGGVVTSLVAYGDALLDERSGYPAGIRDPRWQHGVWAAGARPEGMAELLTDCAVRVCAALRRAGHPSGPADAMEVVRFARDLAAVRSLPAAGRTELAEAVESVLTQGRLLGRGRAVAAAMEEVLVGDRRGLPAPGTPRSGLGPAVEAEAARLGLPCPGEPQRREVRLDPARSPLDRRREVFLRRLAECGVPYGERGEVAGTGGAEAIGTRWTVAWSPSVAAVVQAAGMFGVTPAQAAEGLLRRRAATARQAGGPTAAEALAALGSAAVCALPGLAGEALEELSGVLPAVGTLAELLSGGALLDRLAAGHVPGLDPPPAAGRLRAVGEELAAAAVRALEGMAGATDPADARALVELALRAAATGGGLRLAAGLAALDRDGTPLMRGAAGAARVLLGERDAAGFGRRLAERVRSTGEPAGRAALTGFLTGALTAAGPLLEAGGALDPLVECVEELHDAEFTARLPALRGGFDTLAPAARERFLAAVAERSGSDAAALAVLADPVVSARLAAADLAAGELLRSRGLLPAPADGPVTTAAAGPVTTAAAGPVTAAAAGRTDGPARVAADAVAAPGGLPQAGRSLTPGLRWRLLLGRPVGPDGPGGRLAAALDELYGSGRGEGSRPLDGGTGSGGGSQRSYPGVREWSAELAALFGPGVREEVLAAAAAAGRVDAALEIDPAAARPSVELLRTVLAYAGGLPEERLARLRPLVARLVRELTAALATRLRPALTGLSSARPTRRRGGRLDLAGTVRANLATARRDPDTGRPVVLPERPVFRSREVRAADWRLVLVVDVSGSMEASVVWSAMTAAVLAGVPALSTHFVAFSTEVVDLSGRVEDPLGLLLEVRVGGGTHIAGGLRYARELVTVPSRTLVVLVSDFEEGGPIAPLLAEVRALAASGCRVLGCASLDDGGRPRYSAGVAGQLVAAGMPVAALSPLELARWVGEQVGGGRR